MLFLCNKWWWCGFEWELFFFDEDKFDEIGLEVMLIWVFLVLFDIFLKVELFCGCLMLWCVCFVNSWNRLEFMCIILDINVMKFWGLVNI